jgi:hypothetical protein
MKPLGAPQILRRVHVEEPAEGLQSLVGRHAAGAPPRRERSLPRPGPLCPAPPRQGFRLQWAASLPRFLPARSCRFKSAVPPARKSGAGAPGTRAIRPASLRGQQGRVIYDVRSSSPPWGSKNNEMDLSLKNEMVVHDISHRIFEKSGGADLTPSNWSM